MDIKTKLKNTEDNFRFVLKHYSAYETEQAKIMILTVICKKER